MPVVQCDIRRGRTPEQKAAYGQALTKAVARMTGADPNTILVIFREQPGHDTMEGGVVLPDYQPGPDGKDLAGAEELRRRGGNF